MKVVLIVLAGLLLSISSCTSEEEIPIFEYRVVNISSQPVDLRLYQNNQEVESFRILNEDSLVYKSSGNDQTGFDLFDTIQADSADIIFDNRRIISGKRCLGNQCMGIKNILNRSDYEDIGGNVLRYEITEEDYENASELGGG